MNLANGVYWLASVRNIKFEENKLRKIYRELASKGVDIVNVISYKCIRDPGGAPDIEYALFSPSSVLPVADEAKDIDLLKLQVEIAHEEGLLTRTYLNAHWYGDGFYSKHRDWAQVKADGKPVDNLYGHGYSMCVNTGYRDRMISLAVEVASREVDIIFFDGPAYYPGACYCESCLKKFREIYGEDIPRKEDWESPSWRRFIRFRYESLRDFLVDVRRALRNRGLKTLIYSNTSGQTWPVWQFALSMEHLWEGEDILAAECYQYYTRTREVPVWLYGWTAKYGYSVKKTKPFCLFLSNAHAPWVYYRIPVTERRLASFQGIACGANILEYHDFLQELVDLTKKWSKYFKGIKSAANVALVWSRNSADYIYDEPQPPTGEVSFEAQAVQVGAEKAPATVKEESLKRFVEEARGFYEMLLRLHVPFDVISDINLNKEDLKKYDVLVLPSTVCLSNSQAEAIKEFVSEGGGLIASYEVGLRNEYGDLRENSILSEVIGARFEKLVYGPFQWDYIKLRKHPITEKVLEMIPSPKYCTLVSPTRAEVVAVHMEKLKSRYQKPVKETDIPAILVSEYSRGRVVYFTGNFGGQYWNYGFLDYIKLFKNALNWVNLKEYPLELKGPEFIEATLWRGENWYLIFLANYNYSIRRPFEEVIEAKDIKVRVKAEEPKRVLSLVYLTEYEYRVEQDRILVHVPGIKDYDIILVEY